MQRQTRSSFLLIAAIAGGIGFVVLVALMVVAGLTVSPAALLAIIVALAAAVALFLGLRKGSEADRHDLRPTADGRPGDRTIPAGGVMAPSPDHAGDAVGVAPSAEPDSLPDTSIPTGPDRAADPIEPSEDREEAASGSEDLEDAATDPADRGGEIETDATADHSTASASASDAVGADTKPVEEDDTGPSADDQTASAVESGQKWRSSQLSGSQELAERKGSWTYEGAKPEPESTAPTEAGPPRLSEPRPGGPDNLQRIRGVGPRLEAVLHAHGIYHFDQIAAWSDQDLAWIDEHLEGFRGRASRDDWRSQAQEIAGQG